VRPALAVMLVVIAAAGCGAAAGAAAGRRERIPTGARVVQVTVRKFNRRIQGPITIRSLSAVRRAVALLNTLAPFPPGVFSCPADFGVLIHLAFYRRLGSAALAVASVDPGGCGEVSLTIRGRRQPPLAGGVALTPKLDRALGLKLETGVR
jgi:hypothetical protein